MTDRIESLADLRPGDIMFGPIGGLVPGVFPVGLGQLALGEVFRVGRLSVRHVGIVVEAADALTCWAYGDARPFPCGQDQAHDPHPLGRSPGTPVVGPRLVQAMPGGAEEIELRTGTHWTPRHAYLRLPEDYPGQAKDAAAIARLFVSEKVPYSFASYAALAAWRLGFKAERLANWIDRRRPPINFPAWTPTVPVGANIRLPAEAICSVLADQAWTLAGKDLVTGARSQIVTPGMLATQLLRTPGVVWGLP